MTDGPTEAVDLGLPGLAETSRTPHIDICNGAYVRDGQSASPLTPSTPPGFALIDYVGPGRSSTRSITLKPVTYLFEAGTLDQLESGAEHIWRAAVSVAVVFG